MSPSGSSPLARGLHGRLVAARVVCGIIPARAGFTGNLTNHLGLTADHPRSRGVYASSNGRPSCSTGSSPLARGLLLPLEVGDHLLRIIPARAGFTPLYIGGLVVYTDHPRSRGVYVERRAWEAGFQGSSPLARGLRTFSPGTFWTPSDHPRSRGVYSVLAEESFSALGSSPLARGLRPSGQAARALALDHPRSRGVYGGRAAPFSSRGGSSPLARGLPPAPAGERDK